VKRTADRARVEAKNQEEEARSKEQEVATLVRRRLQTEESREVLAKRRRQQTVEGGDRADPPRVHVRLVQQPRSETAGDATGMGAESRLTTFYLRRSWKCRVRRPVKLDSGSRYTVAGPDWTAWGEKSDVEAPVEYVEGIGGFLLDVLGVWTFEMQNSFGQEVKVAAGIIDGCTSEFLLGVDFLKEHKATVDFEQNKVRYEEGKHQVVIPFRTFDKSGNNKVAVVRKVGARFARGAP